MPDQQPLTTITVEIPDEPPNGSIVIAGGPDGHAFERYDGLWAHKVPNEARWVPTVGWWDEVSRETSRAALTWRQFIAYAREIHILRWGDGKPPDDDSAEPKQHGGTRRTDPLRTPKR